MATFLRAWRKMAFSTRAVNYVYARESSWNPISKTMEPDRPQYNRPATVVIAQQYSIASIV